MTFHVNPEFSRESVLDLAAHIEAGHALCKHDHGHEVHLMIRSLQAKIDTLESVRPKTLADVAEKHCGRAA